MPRITVWLLALLLTCSIWFSSATDSVAAPADDLSLIREVLECVEAYHVDRPERRTLVEGAIWGIIDAVDDPYTTYLTREKLETFMEEIEGRFGGVGVELEASGGKVRVRNVLPGSPAFEAGLQPGDVITAVDGQDITGLAVEMVALRIRGPAGTQVRLTVLRQNYTFEVSLVRRQIRLPNIEDAFWSGGIAYIRIRTFGSATAADLRKALLKYQVPGIKGLIIDLRGNEGGLLDAAAEVAGCFLGRGKEIAWLQGRDGEEPCRATGEALVQGVPVAVLIDENTASAAEILAGALRDYRVAFLLGKPSFGKGSVQELIPLTNGAVLRVTTARYLTPAHRPVDGEGLVPDLEIETPALVPYVAEAVLKGGAVKVKLKVGSTEGEVNGHRVAVTTAPLMEKGKVYLPLRFTAEAFGYRVSWDQKLGAVLEKNGTRLILPFDGKTVIVPDKEKPVALVALPALRDLRLDVRVSGDSIELDGIAGSSANFLKSAG